MDSGFGEPPFAGGDLHNSAAVTSRADPASDGAGSGGVGPIWTFGPCIGLRTWFSFGTQRWLFAEHIRRLLSWNILKIQMQFQLST